MVAPTLILPGESTGHQRTRAMLKRGAAAHERAVARKATVAPVITRAHRKKVAEALRLKEARRARRAKYASKHTV